MKSYYTLVASLPQLPEPFDAGPLPIPRSTLRRRLDLLDDEDREVVFQVSQFFVWDRQTLDRTDQEIVDTYHHLMREISNGLVRELIDYRFQMRTIVAAIRRKRDGEGPPPGVPPLDSVIRRNWDAPDFNLSTRFDWIDAFTQAARAGHAVQAQHILFSDLWRIWTRTSQRYHFTFESILTYLARWEIVERWTSQDANEGRRRFEECITETLGEHAKLN